MIAPAAHAAKPSPSRALYAALLTAPVSTTRSVVTGYYASSVQADAPSANSAKHGAVGEVVVRLSGDTGAPAEITYTVFPTARAAVATWRSGSPLKGQRESLPLPGFPKPGEVVNGSYVDQGKRHGYTNAAFLAGSVLVQAQTVSLTSRLSGDVSGAVRLLRWARSHLAAVRAKAG